MRLGLAWLWLFAAPAAATDDVRTLLDAFSADLSAYQAEFEQRVLDGTGRELENSEGTMALMSPDRFRWHYRTPYEQLIVADGQSVWIHDVELEQVTVRPQGGPQSPSPLYVLTDPGSLEERFELESRGTFHGAAIIGLVPKASAEFEWVELVVRDRLLEALTIQDQFGQQTQIRFSRPQRNPALDATEFQFQPPPGVDVIGTEELEFGLEDE